MQRSDRLFFIAFLSFLLIISGLSLDGRLTSICLAETPSVVINEIMYDVPGTDADHEWIEVYNISNQEIDLSKWKFNDGSNHVLNAPPKNGGQGSIIIPAGGYAILADNAAVFLSDHAGFTGTVIDTVMDLNNTLATLEILDENGDKIDTVSYSKEWRANGNGKSLEKISYEEINAQNSWRESITDGGTPGALNDSGVTTSQSTDEQSDKTASSTIRSLSSSATNTTNRSPIANAGSDIIALVDQGISFDATKSSDPDGDILTYSWNFGDGTTSDEPKVSHSYQYSGTHIVVLEASDGQNVSSDQAKIMIYSDSILISEFLPAPTGDDANNEWIELYNNSDQIADLSGWQVDDIDGGNKPFTIPQNTFLAGHQYLLLSRPTTKISLNNDADSVRLIYPTGQVAQEIQYTKATEGQSVSLAAAGQYIWNSSPTPGGPNFIVADQTTNNQISAAIIQSKDNTESAQNIIQTQVFPVSSPKTQSDNAIPSASISFSSPAANSISSSDAAAKRAKDQKQNNQSASLTETIKSSPATTLIVIVVFGALAGLGLVKIKRKRGA